MSPGSGVGPTRRANNLLLIFLPLTSAVVGSAGRGNVGEYSLYYTVFIINYYFSSYICFKFNNIFIW